MKKIGVLGGTFNPVHKGHEITATLFYDRFELDKLLIIPANIPPHKENDNDVSPSDRYKMCEICFGKYKSRYNIEISDIEIKKDGVSYTIDTVKALREIYPDETNALYFLVGSDMFLYIEQWQKYRELLEMCVFTVAFRNHDESDREEVLKLRESLISQGYKIELLQNNAIEISSTRLRTQIKDKNFTGLTDYLDDKVLEYIKEKKIYVL